MYEFDQLNRQQIRDQYNNSGQFNDFKNRQQVTGYSDQNPSISPVRQNYLTKNFNQKNANDLNNFTRYPEANSTVSTLKTQPIQEIKNVSSSRNFTRFNEDPVGRAYQPYSEQNPYKVGDVSDSRRQDDWNKAQKNSKVKINVENLSESAQVSLSKFKRH